MNIPAILGKVAPKKVGAVNPKNLAHAPLAHHAAPKLKAALKADTAVLRHVK